MSQALRVALWVPTTSPAEVGDAIKTKAAEIAAKVLPTDFFLPGSGGSGGGIEEAPTDGNYYARRNAAWYEVDAPGTGGGGGGGIDEAPIDGRPYVRVDGNWAAFDIIDGGSF